MRWLDGMTNKMDECVQTPGDGEGPRKPGELQSMGLQRVGYNLVTEQQQQNEMSVLNTIIRKISYTGNIMT